jgi:gluconate 2-dehydrogenase gamma chain
MMKPDSISEASDAWTMTRREAIRRTALMLGVAVTPSLLTGVMRAQAATPKRNAPAYLTAKQFETAGAIAERILPKTDTPGARDVGVPAFIDLMYGKYMTPSEKRVFASGLDEVESGSTSANKRSFSSSSPAQQDALLTTIAKVAQDRENTFFHLMREMTLLGYFTSEPIGKNVLHYDPIPGRYDGCIPLSEVGNKAWTR